VISGNPGPNQTVADTAAQIPTYHASVADVQVDAEVVDGRRQIDGLMQQDFVILDENKPRQIVYFGHSSVPLELVLLLDVSGSVQKYLKDIAAIATSALRKHECLASMNQSVTRDEPVAIDYGLFHTEVAAAVANELVEFFERALVEQQIHPLARRKFAVAVLALLPFRTAPRLRARMALPHLIETAAAHLRS
jgi:hypothetical protein